MDVSFSSGSMQKICNSRSEIIKCYGEENGKKLMMRLNELYAALNLSYISVNRPSRLHLLGQNRRGEFAVDLKHPYRLVFRPNHDPIPLLKDGGVDKAKITRITIIEVVDYHG